MMSSKEINDRHILFQLGLFETQWIREYAKFQMIYPFDRWYIIEMWTRK